MAEWRTLAKARNDFADMLDGLSEEQLEAQSLCDRWRTVDVAGHLVSLIETSPMALVMGYAKNRHDPDSFVAETAIDFGDNKGAAALAESLRAHASKRLRPFSEASMVADTAVHTQDIRRPLGLTDPLDPEVLRMSLDHSIGDFTKGREIPLRFVANDIDWSAGVGEEVHGTGEALLMALNGRDVSAELAGPGVELLG